MESEAPVAGASSSDSTRKQIRGSGLLLVGRLLAMGMGFVVQVLIVRYLSKSDYGAFAYALSVVTLGTTFVLLGLDKTITRFIPIYHEKNEYNHLFGALVLMAGTVLVLGLVLVVGLFALQGWIGREFVKDALALQLLVSMIALAPVRALDELLVGLFAIFASPRTIFFRRHLLAPGLELLVVVLLVVAGSGVFFLVGGYVAAGAFGVCLYLVILFRILHRQGLFQHFNPRTISLPVREIFGFSLPLMVSNLVYVLQGAVVVMFLEYFQNTTEVANFRAVLPVARLNLIVFQSFTFLFMPVAARMFARQEWQGIDDLYWQTAIWIALLSFPIFLATFSLAQPVTVLLFGQRYADSALILALLALGNYFNAALGFNGYTLRVYGDVRYLFGADLLMTVVTLAANLVLIPRYGALGAAIGTCGTLIAQNLLYQIGLGLRTTVSLFQWRYLRVYLILAASAVGVLLIQFLFAPPIYLGLAIAAAVSMLTLGLNRKVLNVQGTFPELLRLPLVPWLLGVRPAPRTQPAEDN